MTEWLDEILRCPSCKGFLELSDSRLVCSSCGARYGKYEQLWDLLPADASELKLLERCHYTEKTDYYLSMHRTWCGSPFYRHYHSSFLNDLRRLPPRSLILETGCGLGHDGLELLHDDYRLVETDIAPGQLEEAQKLHQNSGFGRESAHLLADAERLPFASDTFDGAFMAASLHHLPDPPAALREIRRVLKRGGIFALGTEPNSWQNYTIYPLGKSLLGLIKRLTGKDVDSTEMVSEADQLMEGFSRGQLDDLFGEAGFDRWELKPAGYLSAAIFFLSTESSNLLGRNIRLFPLERLAIYLDEILGGMPLLRRYPWHWNAVAS
ncbi:MAG: methyltransferase domain-containing protein [Actinomycetota bacterium]|nr:methyltransferase domain-containing protein [Actinomycetota bacterium]